MSAREIQNRILTLHERQLASLVDDISRIEANSYHGVGVIKVYLHEGADVSRAVSQLASSALVVLKYMPPQHHAAAGAALRRDRRADHPAQPGQRHAPGHQAQRPRAEHHPPGLAVVHGARGAVSVRRQAARDHGGPGHARAAGARTCRRPTSARRCCARTSSCRPATSRSAPRTTRSTMNNSPDVIEAINDFPIKRGRRRARSSCATSPTCTTATRCRPTRWRWTARPAALMIIRKTGGVSTLAVIDGDPRGPARHPATAAGGR